MDYINFLQGLVITIIVSGIIAYAVYLLLPYIGVKPIPPFQNTWPILAVVWLAVLYCIRAILTELNFPPQTISFIFMLISLLVLLSAGIYRAFHNKNK